MKDNILLDKSFIFAVRIVKLYKYLCSQKKEYVLSKQLLRSGTSIGANINEAQDNKSKNDYQLVTELSKIVRSYKNKNKPVDRNFVDSVLLSCIKNDVVDVKNGIKSSDDNDVFGYFDIDSIFINYSFVFYNKFKC